MGRATERPPGFCIESGKKLSALAQPPGISDPGLGRDWNHVEGRIRRTPLGIEETRRRVAQIDAMIADFDRMVGALDDAIRAEQNRSGIHDPAHVAYSITARAMTQRRDNLNRSIDALKRQLAEARVTLE